jgi:hypothetical protein
MLTLQSIHTYLEDILCLHMVGLNMVVSLHMVGLNMVELILKVLKSSGLNFGDGSDM